jgi:hypothetical protein
MPCCWRRSNHFCFLFSKEYGCNTSIDRLVISFVVPFTAFRSWGERQRERLVVTAGLWRPCPKDSCGHIVYVSGKMRTVLVTLDDLLLVSQLFALVDMNNQQMSQKDQVLNWACMRINQTPRCCTSSAKFTSGIFLVFMKIFWRSFCTTFAHDCHNDSLYVGTLKRVNSSWTFWIIRILFVDFFSF